MTTYDRQVASDDNLRRDRARDLRQASTDAEKKLWGRFRNSQLLGVRFRRQFPIGSYFADFCAPREFLVIELDGSQHLEFEDADLRRTEVMRSLGYRVIRFWNSDVLASIDEVLQQITDSLKDPHPPRATHGGLSLPGRGSFERRR